MSVTVFEIKYFDVFRLGMYRKISETKYWNGLIIINDKMMNYRV